MSPLSSKDGGIRLISCLTNTTHMPNREIAEMLVRVSNWSVNNYYHQELRRRVSILERPLTTARGDGKSYIYANYNPKYAQYVTTIFRTFYNFCWEKGIKANPKKKIKGNRKTPAMGLGIADKVYDIKDIIYFK